MDVILRGFFRGGGVFFFSFYFFIYFILFYLFIFLLSYQGISFFLWLCGRFHKMKPLEKISSTKSAEDKLYLSMPLYML